MWGLPEDVRQDDHTKNMSTLITLEESDYLKITSTSKEVIKDTQDAQENCVSTLVNTFEKDEGATEMKSRKNCLPHFKTADNHAIEPFGKGRSLVGYGHRDFANRVIMADRRGTDPRRQPDRGVFAGYTRRRCTSRKTAVCSKRDSLHADATQA